MEVSGNLPDVQELLGAGDEEQDDELSGAAVDAVEVHSARAPDDPQGGHGVLDALDRGVGNRDAVLHARRHGPLAGDDGLADVLGLVRRDQPPHSEVSQQEIDGIPLVARIEVDQHVFGAE